MTYPHTITLSFPPKSSSVSPAIIPPCAPQTIAPFSLPALQAGLGHVYILARSQPTAARAPSRESDISFAPDIREGITVLSVCVPHSKKARLSIKIRRLFCNDAAYGSLHSGQRDGCGDCTSTSGGGRVVELPWVLWFPLTRWFRDMPSLRWVRDVRGTRFATKVLTSDGPKTQIYDFNTLPYRRHANHPHRSHLNGTSTEYADDDCGSGWSTITEQDKRQCARQPVWEETGIKPGQRLQNEVVTRLAYLELTGVDSDEYSGLMIDGE